VIATAPTPSVERADRARTSLEVGGAFTGATAVAAVLYHARSIAFIDNNLHALVAAVFIVLPQLLLRGRGEIERYGFTSRPRKLGLIVAAVGVGVVLPLFVAGFVLWNRALCAYEPRWVPGSCFHLLHPRFRLPDGPPLVIWRGLVVPGFIMLVLAQLIVVALPEELFFRAFVQGRLEDAWPPRWRLLGARVGGAWIVAAVLFGLGHYFVSFEPQMLTRVFPGLLFGWMYSRTRSILAGTIFHAACNLLMETLATSFLT
jgi:membrane protease YdiL (CAAX protease family)